MGRKGKGKNKGKSKGKAAERAEEHEVAQSNKRKDRAMKAALKKEERRRRGMRDKAWEADFAALDAQCALLGLHIKDVNSDGNCLFSAISDQLHGNPRFHFDIRAQVMDYIENNREDFEWFIEDDEPFEKYVAKMKRRAEWGGNLEIQAASMTFNVNICIHILNSPRMEVNNWGPDVRTIHLSYHDGQHYASVRPIGEESMDGVPDAVVIVSSAPRPQPAREVKKSLEPTMDEAIIMRSAGVLDVELIRNTLADNGGDVNATIDLLTQIQYASGAYDDPTIFDRAADAAFAHEATSGPPESVIAAAAAAVEAELGLDGASGDPDNNNNSSSTANTTTTTTTTEQKGESAPAAATAAAAAGSDNSANPSISTESGGGGGASASTSASATAVRATGVAGTDGDSDKKSSKPPKRMTKREKKRLARLKKAEKAQERARNPELKANDNKTIITADIRQGDFGAIGI